MTVEPYDYARIPADGRAFEEYVGQMFADLGYGVEVTPASGDFGADVILTEPGAGRRIAVQAKFYGSVLDGAPVREVACSLAHYHAAEGWVVTNSAFTPAARQLAAENGVRLVEGPELRELVAAAEANRAAIVPEGGARVWRDLDFRGLEVQGEGVPDALDAPDGTWRDAPASGPGALDVTTPLGSSEVARVLPGGDAGPAARATVPLPCVGAPTKVVRGAGGDGGAAESRYSLSELAGLWGVSTNRVYRMITEEGMPMVRMPNGRWEIGACELADWTRAHDERVEREARRERSRRTRRVAASVACWTVVALLALAAIVVVSKLVQEIAAWNLSGAFSQVPGLADIMRPGAQA